MVIPVPTSIQYGFDTRVFIAAWAAGGYFRYSGSLAGTKVRRLFAFTGLGCGSMGVYCGPPLLGYQPGDARVSMSPLAAAFMTVLGTRVLDTPIIERLTPPDAEPEALVTLMRTLFPDWDMAYAQQIAGANRRGQGDLVSCTVRLGQVAFHVDVTLGEAVGDGERPIKGARLREPTLLWDHLRRRNLRMLLCDVQGAIGGAPHDMLEAFRKGLIQDNWAVLSSAGDPL